MSAVQKGRGFDGTLDVSGSAFAFTYLPLRAEIVNRKLNLIGTLTITDRGHRERTRQNVRSIVASTQGGMGTGSRRASASGRSDLNRHPSAATRNTAEQAGGLPLTEGAGELSFCGVMYLRLEALNGPDLGVRADLTRTQLNARLIAETEIETTLQNVYSEIVEALHSEKPDVTAAARLTKELNAQLSRS